MSTPPRGFWLGTAGLVATAASLALLQGALAGDFHQYGSLVCSDCHVMHYSESHSVTGGAPSTTVPLGSGGPFPKLLRQDESQLCLACHDGRTDAPDVLGANSAGTFARAAGALSKVGDTGTYAEGNGHSLGSTAAPPGGTWTGNQAGGLQCKHCHDVHGNAYYRNLTPNPGTATGKFVTYLIGATYSGTAAVQQIAVAPLATHYSVGNILYRQTKMGTTDFGMSQWCSGCHGDYYVTSSTTGGHHTTDNLTMAQAVTNGIVDPVNWFSALASRVPVVSSSGIVPGTSGTSDNQVSCGTCHKAHGSEHPYGLVYDDATTAALEDGTSQTQTCQQCHNQ